MMKVIPSLFALCALSAGAMAFNGTVGGLSDRGSGDPNEVVSKVKKKKVKPGQNHCNTDGVCVTNNQESSGDATVDPEVGSGISETTVTTQSGFEGTITGIDANDTVNLGPSNNGSVSGAGGTVNTGSSSTLTISNGTGGGNMTVNLVGGSEITIPPGNSIQLST